MPTSAEYDAVYAPTDAQLLAATRSQIGAITLTGVAYTINGRSLTKVDLPKLWDQVHELEGRINNSDGTGGIALAAFS